MRRRRFEFRRRPKVQLTKLSLLWFAALLSGFRVKNLQHGGCETANGFGPRWGIHLFATPFVQALQKLIGGPHLKQTSLNASRRAPHNSTGAERIATRLPSSSQRNSL